MEVCQVEAEFFFFFCGRIDRQTDMTKLIIACRDLANTPYNAMQIPQFQALFYPIFRRETVPHCRV